MMAPVSIASRYTLKDDPYSSHSVILDWLGDARGRRLLDAERRPPVEASLPPRGPLRVRRAGYPRPHAPALLHAAHADGAGEGSGASHRAADVDARAALSAGADALARARAGRRARAERAHGA